MYIISRMESGKVFGEVLETGYYVEGDNWMDVEEDLRKHDVEEQSK